MRLNIFRGGFLICSLLWGTVLGLDDHDTQLARRQPRPQDAPPVTITVIVTTRWTVTETTTATITGTPTPTNVVTVTSTESATTTSTKTITVQPNNAQGAPVQKRQAGPPTVTVLSTTWDWQDTTTTVTVTSTVMPAQALAFIAVNLSTMTEVTTKFSTLVTEKTVTASSTSSPTPDTQAAPVSNWGPTMNKAKPPNIELILGASFAALVGTIGIFVLAYLFAKKRHNEALRKESCGVEAQESGKSARAGAAGATGLLGTVLGKKVRQESSAARYNSLPTSENTTPLPLAPPPSHSPPPQLPLLNVNPPDISDFNCEYSFGSPVSSIGGDREIPMHAFTTDIAVNRMSPAPPYSAAPDALAYATAIVRAEEERSRQESLQSIKGSGNMEMQALDQKPLPTP